MKIHKTAIIPYTQEEMFDLVNDIESYPQFLPGCEKVMILERNDTEIKAMVCISKGNISKSFSTINTLNRPHSISMRLLDGPFNYLEGAWHFTDNSDINSSEILFDLDFEFKNKLMGMMAGPILTKILESFVDAFCQRAKEVYGER